MKLWLISQDKNNNYDTYDSAVVAANTEEEARKTYPDKITENWDGKEERFGCWADMEFVQVKLIGIALKGTKSGVVCASFNAG